MSISAQTIKANGVSNGVSNGIPFAVPPAVPPAPPNVVSIHDPHSVWDQLTSWLNYWFHEPDVDALRLCACAAATHYYDQERPLWLFVIGNSGSGKTRILIESFKDLPDSQVIGSLTPKCFLSSWSRGGKGPSKENSMLLAGGASQIWLAKDFTTFASMRMEARAEVGSRLREIADGEFVSNTGGGPQQYWDGKVTMLAVATPEFEDHWSAMRGLGERFLTVRWREPRDINAALAKVRQQAGHESEISAELRRLMTELCLGRMSYAPMPTDMSRLDALAQMVAILRVHVVHESDSARSIIRIPEPEFPSRIALALAQTIRTHMDLFHRLVPLEEDYQLATRLAMDSIPPARRRLLAAVVGNRDFTYRDLLIDSKLPRTTLERQINDLVAMRVFEPPTPASGDWSARTTTLTPFFASLLADSGISFRHPNPKIDFTKTLRRGRKPSSNPDLATY